MMIPPTFSDLGKAAKDLFDKNFKFGLFTLENKAKCDSGLGFTVHGDHDIKAGSIGGHLEAKRSFDNGITYTGKVDTKNVITEKLQFDEILAKNLKHTVIGTFKPDTGDKSLKLESEYAREYLNHTLDLEFFSMKPLVSSSVLLGLGSHGYFAGGEVSYDTSDQNIKGHKLAVGYQTSDLSMVSSVTNKVDFQGSLFHQIKKDLQLGVKLGWNINNKENIKFGAACRYEIDQSSFVKARIDQNNLLGVSYGFNATDTAKVTLCSQWDLMHINGGNHNYGITVEFSH